MKTDRELLELAAKAAGVICSWAHEDEADYSASTEGMWLNGARSPSNSKFWNPLTDDADALRLAIKLKISMCYPDWEDTCEVWGDKNAYRSISEDAVDHDNDLAKAARRAIVRAAAEIAEGIALFPTAEQIQEDWP